MSCYEPPAKMGLYDCLYLVTREQLESGRRDNSESTTTGDDSRVTNIEVSNGGSVVIGDAADVKKNNDDDRIAGEFEDKPISDEELLAQLQAAGAGDGGGGEKKGGGLKKTGGKKGKGKKKDGGKDDDDDDGADFYRRIGKLRNRMLTLGQQVVPPSATVPQAPQGPPTLSYHRPPSLASNTSSAGSAISSGNVHMQTLSSLPSQSTRNAHMSTLSSLPSRRRQTSSSSSAPLPPSPIPMSIGRVSSSAGSRVSRGSVRRPRSHLAAPSSRLSSANLPMTGLSVRSVQRRSSTPRRTSTEQQTDAQPAAAEVVSQTVATQSEAPARRTEVGIQTAPAPSGSGRSQVSTQTTSPTTAEVASQSIRPTMRHFDQQTVPIRQTAASLQKARMSELVRNRLRQLQGGGVSRRGLHAAAAAHRCRNFTSTPSPLTGRAPPAAPPPPPPPPQLPTRSSAVERRLRRDQRQQDRQIIQLPTRSSAVERRLRRDQRQQDRQIIHQLREAQREIARREKGQKRPTPAEFARVRSGGSIKWQRVLPLDDDDEAMSQAAGGADVEDQFAQWLQSEDEDMS